MCCYGNFRVCLHMSIGVCLVALEDLQHEIYMTWYSTTCLLCKNKLNTSCFEGLRLTYGQLTPSCQLHLAVTHVPTTLLFSLVGPSRQQQLLC